MGIVAGSVQSLLAQYDHVLPSRLQGFSLMVLGGMVAAVGTYNTLKEYFGWRDES